MKLSGVTRPEGQKQTAAAPSVAAGRLRPAALRRRKVEAFAGRVAGERAPERFRVCARVAEETKLRHGRGVDLKGVGARAPGELPRVGLSALQELHVRAVLHDVQTWVSAALALALRLQQMNSTTAFAHRSCCPSPCRGGRQPADRCERRRSPRQHPRCGQPSRRPSGRWTARNATRGRACRRTGRLRVHRCRARGPRPLPFVQARSGRRHRRCRRGRGLRRPSRRRRRLRSAGWGCC